MCMRVRVCVSECFMTLSSVDEREEVSSVIYSHRQSCPICVSRHRFALSHTQLAFHTFSQPPSFAPRALPLRPLLITLCISDNSPTAGGRHVCISLSSPRASNPGGGGAPKSASSSMSADIIKYYHSSAVKHTPLFLTVGVGK